MSTPRSQAATGRRCRASARTQVVAKPHDPYRILPFHTPQELAALRASIESEGLHDSIIIDTEGNVIDGHARRDICQELGIDWLAGADVRIGLTDLQKRTIAISVNLARRSTAPTQEQRREYAKILLQSNVDSESPESDARIAAVVGLSRQTVQRLRSQLAQSSKLKTALITVGKDGKIRTVSSEKRRARFQVKSKTEFDRIAPVAHELQHSPKLGTGIIRRPNRLPAMLRRERALAEVERSKPKPLPSSIDIRCCDFRNLEIEQESVDLICTDVEWAKRSEPDWEELARLSKAWLKPDGMFATFIGQGHLDRCLTAFSKHLSYLWTFCYTFKGTSRVVRSNIVEGWRPIVVFGRSAAVDFHWVLDRIDLREPPEKDYDDWQQPLPVVKELIRRLLPRDGSSVVLDPHLGTGTSAVACCQLSTSGETKPIRFIGCDIESKKVKTARYRVAKEGNTKNAG